MSSVGIQYEEAMALRPVYLHLPMVPHNWEHIAWVLDQIKIGKFKKPRVVSLENGGVGCLMKPDSVREDIIRLEEMVKGEDDT